MVEWLTEVLESWPTDATLWAVVLVFIALDVALGTFKGWMTHTLSSSKARDGIMHKMGFVGAMLLSTLIDVVQGLSIGAQLGFTVPVSLLCAAMVVMCEVMSICEHIKELNPEVDLKFLEHFGSNEKTGSDE